MAMSSAHRKTLDKTLEVLTEDMDVLPAIIHLKSKEIMSDLDEEKINAKQTEKEKVMEFVKIVKKRGKKAYLTLRDYFENCRGSEHLAEELDLNLKAVEEKLQGLQLERDGRKQIDRWNEFEKKFHYFACKKGSIDQYKKVPNDVNILLIGKTGSGKSATGNTILGESHFKATNYNSSATKTIDMKNVKEDRFNITVIDTPGLFDTAKDFRNEDLLLEIAKTMITFNGGIHLFLLVCNGTVRFTKEEQDTIEVIERILSKSVYNNCVLILTNAYAQFGTKDKTSLRDLVAHEQKCGGNFAELLNRVKCRIIAVENCFDDEFLSEKHRQRLLCYLAQVIHESDGFVYSNSAFENAKIRVEHQETERKKRITRGKELTKMKQQLRNYLMQNYLIKKSEQQLNVISGLFQKESLLIKIQSGVQQLENITKEDVEEYLSSFTQENGAFIQNLIDVRQQQAKQQREYEKRRDELIKKEEINRMQSIVLPLVGNRLRQFSMQQLEEIDERRQLPDTLMEEVINCVRACKITSVGKGHIAEFITETFFGNTTQIKRYIDDKMLQKSLEEKAQQLRIVKREQRLNTLKKSLKTKLPEELEGKDNEELHKLKSDLDNGSRSRERAWMPMFEALVGTDIAESGVSSEELCELYLDENSNFLHSVLATALEKREKQKEASDMQEKEQIKNSAFGKISEEIEDNLKSYLVGRTARSIRDLNSKIQNGEVPQEIIDQVSECLTEAQKECISDEEIQKEVLEQLREQSELIEKCKEEAECFPGSTDVTCKVRGNCKICDIKVGDEILVHDENGRLFYDKVYLLTHAMQKKSLTCISLQTSSGKQISLSPGHLLPVGCLRSNVAAEDIVVGDVIFTSQNGVMASDTVTSVSWQVLEGLYCPLTMNGAIIVNDVAASCYTTFLPSRLSHVLLSPVRLLFNTLPLYFFVKLTPYDDVEGMPVILLKCRDVLKICHSVVRKCYRLTKGF